MIKLCKHNQQNVLEKVRNGQLDAIALSTTNLVDDIILQMNEHQIFKCIKDNIPDRRSQNNTIPYELIWICSIAAKMKIHTSLADIPFAINDHRTIAKLGYTIIDDNGNLKNSLMREGTLRSLLNKYDSSFFVDGYNNTVQKGILPLLDIVPDIHILDCTDLEVNYSNQNYEQSGIAKSKRNNMVARGYKLATLRGIVGDTGVIEDIRFGSLNVHDLKLSEEMLKTSPMLKENDILINDRGFLSRELINYLKTKRKVDTYTPLRKDMDAYIDAVSIAKYQNNWQAHPNKRRTSQVITFVDHIGDNWTSSNPKEDVPINACVVWDKDSDEYFVFITTDLTKRAKDILNIYQLRPEIEEDYRQLKDFWKIEDFKSTKINVILFHIICVLFGYLFFQLYTLFPEGEKFSGKSFPVILKSYKSETQPYVVLYVDNEFSILKLIELMDLYALCDDRVKDKFKTILN